MALLSDYLENKLIDHLFRSTAFPLPSPPAVWIALGTAATDSSFTELSGGGYARVSKTLGLSSWYSTQDTLGGASSGTSGETRNSLVITFPTATATWNAGADITHFALFNASTGGNMWLHSPLAWPVRVYLGDAFTVPDRALVIGIN